MPGAGMLLNEATSRPRGPREDGAAQEAQTTRLVRHLRIVTRLKRPLVREQEAPGERMAQLPTVELTLDPVAEVGLLDRRPTVLLGF